MDPFKTVNKISFSTILFGVVTLLLGWSVNQIYDPIFRLEIGVFALVFLVLFFYSLIMDRISQIEERIKIISSGRKRRYAKLVP